MLKLALCVKLQHVKTGSMWLRETHQNMLLCGKGLIKLIKRQGRIAPTQHRHRTNYATYNFFLKYKLDSGQTLFFIGLRYMN